MMKKTLFAFSLAVLVLASAAAYAANVGDSWVYTARLAGDKDATIDLSPFMSFVGAYGSSGAACTMADIPAVSPFGLYISSNVPVVGVRSGTYSIALPADGKYEVFVGWATSTSAKANAKHVITYKDGATAEVLVDQLNQRNLWVSLGTYDFAAAQNALITLTNDNQSASGSLYFHSAKFVLTEIAAVPEPASILALCTGLVGILGIRRRRA